MASGLPLVPDFLANFIERWAVKRLPQGDHQATIVRQRLYILPTRYGLIFAVVLATILLGAINYENSLGYMLSFLFVSICLLGMVYTHQNINHLHLSSAHAAPVFAGQTALFPVSVKSTRNNSHYNVYLQGASEDKACVHLPQSDADTQVQLPLATQKRGYIPAGRIKIYTEFPFGLFHAWSWIELNTQALVYPAPDPHPPRFFYAGQQGGQHATQLEGYDDYAGIREYRRGDSPNHLAWKAIARTGELQTKHFCAEVANEIWLSWYQLPEDMNTEKKLSVLCRWVLDAEHQSIQYGLKVPGKDIPPGSGLHHRHDCLKALALFGQGES